MDKMGFQTGIKLTENILMQGIKQAKGITSNSYVTKMQQFGLDLKKISGDTMSLRNKTPLSEVLSYMQGIARDGKGFKPIFENPNSAFAQYVKEVEEFNAKELAKGTKKIGLFTIKAKKTSITIEGFKNYIFDNAEKLNVSKEEYWQLVDKIAKDVKEATLKDSLCTKYMRKEFLDNADKIHKWGEIFATQDKINGKFIFNKYYDEKMYNQAVKEYTEFVEKLTGKKVLIGCTSRMNFPISALGLLNNPKAYKDVDYILLGHGKNSSLITDTMHPNTWRFSDNDKSIYEFIEQNVPKDKKVMVYCCETDGAKKAIDAGFATTKQIEELRAKIPCIGNEVSGWFETTGGAKICQSGKREVVGQISASKQSQPPFHSKIGALKGYSGKDFSLGIIPEPIIQYK